MLFLILLGLLSTSFFWTPLSPTTYLNFFPSAPRLSPFVFKTIADFEFSFFYSVSVVPRVSFLSSLEILMNFIPSLAMENSFASSFIFVAFFLLDFFDFFLGSCSDEFLVASVSSNFLPDSSASLSR